MKTGSQIFDFKRYADCIKRDLTLNGRAWLIRAALMVAVMTIMLVLVSRDDIHGMWNAQTISIEDQMDHGFNVLRVCMFIFTAIGASLFMENMTSPGKRLNELMSPASTLEKYLSRWTVCVLGVTIGFFVCFSLAELLRILIMEWIWGDINGLVYCGPFKLLKQAERWYFPWCIMAAIQATFVLGSTVWPKKSFQKTFGFMFALQILLVLTVIATDELLMPDPSQYVLKITPYDFTQDDLFRILSVSSLVWTAYCYIVSFFRMRESEIIHRF